MEIPPSLQARWRPLAPLGEGGMGIVWRARDEHLDRDVAVKLVVADTQAGYRERLAREGQVLSDLDHPRLPRVYDLGVADEGVAYMVSEFVPGTPLADLAAGPENLERLLEVAEALDAVHAAGIVHRDVKPANILVQPGRGAVLIDFGFAHARSRQRLTRTGQVLGTLRFTAPECYRGQPPDPRADWYSWGATLYEAVEGRRVFSGEDAIERAAGRPVPAPTLSVIDPGSPLAEVLRAALSADPSDRPAGREHVLAMLGRSHEGTGGADDEDAGLAALMAGVDEGATARGGSPEPGRDPAPGPATTPPQARAQPSTQPQRLRSGVVRTRPSPAPASGAGRGARVAATTFALAACLAFGLLTGEGGPQAVIDLPAQAEARRVRAARVARARALAETFRADVARIDPGHPVGDRTALLSLHSRVTQVLEKEHARAVSERFDLEYTNRLSQALESLVAWAEAAREAGAAASELPAGVDGLVHTLEDALLVEEVLVRDRLLDFGSYAGGADSKALAMPIQDLRQACAEASRALARPGDPRAAAGAESRWAREPEPPAVLALRATLLTYGGLDLADPHRLAARAAKAFGRVPGGPLGYALGRAALMRLAVAASTSALSARERGVIWRQVAERVLQTGVWDPGPERARLVGRALIEGVRLLRVTPEAQRSGATVRLLERLIWATPDPMSRWVAGQVARVERFVYAEPLGDELAQRVGG